MFKKWIDEIRAQSDLYKSDCWKYHLSGNVIELSILPAYMKQRKTYRCSVIAVGQVLHALSEKIESEHLSFHIQSFPNLESPEIVAAIRSDEKNEFIQKSTWNSKNFKTEEDLMLALQKLAKKYQVDMHSIQNPPKDQQMEVPFNHFSKWIVLSSKFNNPFTWLNIGYLKESFRSNFSDRSNSDHFCFLDFCAKNHEKYQDLQVPESRFIQSLIGIEPSDISV